MKQFFKIFTGSCLGTIAGLGLLFLLFLVFGAMLAAAGKKSPKSGVLKLEFSQVIPELTENVSRSPYDMSGDLAIGLNDVKKLIEGAASDKKIKGILLNADMLSAGPASVSEVRMAIDSFRRSGKFVYAYADIYGQSGYYLSTIADSILLNPNGAVDLRGYSMTSPYFKDMLDRAGVKMNIFYAGQFKSATEPFRRNSMSEQSKTQTREYLNDLFNIAVNDMAVSRNMSTQQLQNAINTYEGREANKALNAGLVDQLSYWDEVESMIKTALDKSKNEKINYISLEDYYDAAKLKKR